jgi:hypothetical protein
MAAHQLSEGPVEEPGLLERERPAPPIQAAVVVVAAPV